ncbi:MAG: nicotinate (nicotinamide) nucleotide adenylyltransferase [Chlamydiales bacterium]
MKKIGLYGGTFNPVHFGHINLAIELKEKKKLDEVWVIPAHLSPFSKEEPITSASHRFMMAKEAFSEIPNFKVLDIEIQRPAPSYTIDTVKEILEKDRGNSAFFLLMGDDTFLGLSDWKGSLEIVQHLSLLIGSRSGIDIKEKLLNLTLPEPMIAAIEEGIIKTSRIEISATVIRHRLKRKLYCGHLIPAKVLDYIYENQLYFNLDLCS